MQGDESLHARAALAEESSARADRLELALANVLRLFSCELSEGYATTEQQQALREARACLADGERK